MQKRYYIAYGSNLNIRQMRWRCPDARIIGTAELEDWRLLFRGSKTGSYLTIEEAQGHRVPVAVWEVSPEDEEALDRYGYYGHPFREGPQAQGVCVHHARGPAARDPVHVLRAGLRGRLRRFPL